MRILQVITDTDRRGAQVFATDLGVALAEAGHDVTTVALAPGSQQRSLDVPVLGSRRRSPSTIRALRRRMASADITVAHGSATGLACALTLRPFVYRQISDTRFWAAGWVRRVRVATYLRRARHIVALSGDAAAAVEEHLWIPRSRVTVVPNGVSGAAFISPDTDDKLPARRRLGLEGDGVMALYIGALVPEKGVDLAIRAVAGVGGIQLAVAGGGPEEANLRALAAELGAPVTFLGVLDDTQPAYVAADINVLPSRTEGMPATLIEAGFCGLPSVATPVGSIEEIVVDGATGVIVPIDDVDALRNAIVRLRDDAATRQTMGAAARQHCLDRFEIGVVAAQWIDVLERARRR